MNQNTQDLEILALNCRSEVGRSYIKESISAYYRGLYRSAIVSAWIAIVFDLIEKIRELSLSGDTKARRIEQDFDNLLLQIEQGNPTGITQSLEFERNILETFKIEFSYFTPAEASELSRLRDDRNRCAHPSFHRSREPYCPSAELARLHMRNAIHFVLSRPPIYGKAAIDDFLLIVGSNFFPKTIEKAMPVVEKSSLHSPTPGLIRGTIDALLHGFLEPQSPVYKSLGVPIAMNCIRQLHNSEVASHLQQRVNRVILQVKDPDFFDFLQAMTMIRDLYELLDDSSRSRIEEFFKVSRIEEIAIVFPFFMQNSSISTHLSLRIPNLSEEELSMLANKSFSLPALKDRIIELLTNSRNWGRTNELTKKLLIPIFPTLTADEAKKILLLPKTNKADFVGAVGFSQFVCEVYSSKVVQNDELFEILTEIKADSLIDELKEI